MPLSLESNSPSDLNTDPILYLTYLHNGTGQEFFFSPALSCIATLPFVGPPLLMLQNKQTLHAEVYRPPEVFIFLLCKQANPVSGKPIVSNPAPGVQLSDHAEMNHAAPQVAFARTACLENCVCETLLRDRKRNGNDDRAKPDYKYLLKGPVTALPSAVVLYMHISVNTLIEFSVQCLLPTILQAQMHRCDIRLLKMFRKKKKKGLLAKGWFPEAGKPQSKLRTPLGHREKSHLHPAPITAPVHRNTQALIRPTFLQ